MKNSETQLDVKDDEKHLLLDHDYDGIQELNHPLPRWWNIIFYTAIIFGIVYFVYYVILNGPSLRDELKKEYQVVMKAQEEFKRVNSMFDENFYNSIVSNDGLNKGAVVFENNCLACHNEKGKGDIGPNLTDEYWILAKGTPDTVYNVVFNGSEENGMPAWAELLPKEEIYQAVVYVMSLKNTHQKGGKEPQGEKIED